MNKMQDEEAMSTSKHAVAYGPTSHTISSATMINSEMKNPISKQNLIGNKDELYASCRSTATASAVDSMSKRTSDPSVYEVL